MKEFWIQIFKCSGMGNLIKIEFFVYIVPEVNKFYKITIFSDYIFLQ